MWFEHDLFDQTMLWYLLRWFSGQTLGRTKLSLLCIGEFPGVDRFRGLGQLTVAQLKTLSGTWRVEPTAFGRAAEAGETDAIREIEMDEWYGGLRLEGRIDWRWDAKTERAVFEV